MSRSRVLPLALAACTAAVTLSGCAAGFDPYTSPSLKPRDGANYPAVGNTSPVAVRHAFILGPSPDELPYTEGGDAAVYMSVVNQTTEADQLVSASSPAAEEVAVGTGKGGSGIEVPTPPEGQAEGDPVLVGQPPYAENTVTLTGLSRDLRNSSIVQLTLTFQRAGEITLQVPVVPRAGHRATLSPAASAESPAESPSESPTGTGGTGTETPTGEATPTDHATE